MQGRGPVLAWRGSWLNNLLPPKKGIDSINALSNYLANFDWAGSFWKRTNVTQFMHVLCKQGMDGSRGLAQLWIRGLIEYAALEMKPYRTFTLKICIDKDDRSRLKTGLKRNGSLRDNWSTNAIELVIAISAKPDFIESQIEIMPDDDSKTTVLRILEDDKFPFTYDMRD